MPDAPAPSPWLALRVIRHKDGMTLPQLSILSKIAKGHLSDLENGKRQPTPQIIAALAEALNVPKAVLEPRAVALSEAVIGAVADAREDVA